MPRKKDTRSKRPPRAASVTGSTECDDYSGACLGPPCRELDGLNDIAALLSRSSDATVGVLTQLLCRAAEFDATELISGGGATRDVVPC
ncbi:hypothetical protein ACOKM5_20195 [Streptomyces sp. BH097]|uniref:hypothetical protein n=1 Tax=unclassified Streptomyces TaxID=2593676 RepID=UPI003BB6C04E